MPQWTEATLPILEDVNYTNNKNAVCRAYATQTELQPLADQGSHCRGYIPTMQS